MNNQDIVKEELSYEDELDGLMKIRKEKLEELQKEGKNPFDITKYDRTDYAKEIIENFKEDEEKNVSVAGRIITKRVMGKASFFNLQDETGKIQVYISLNDVEDKYLDFKKYDLGDIVGVKGFVFKTKTGEISIHAKDIVLLTKTLRPFPDKFKGLKDVDLRYRHRELDLIVNPKVKETFIKRIQILRRNKKIFK